MKNCRHCLQYLAVDIILPYYQSAQIILSVILIFEFNSLEKPVCLIFQDILVKFEFS